MDEVAQVKAKIDIVDFIGEFVPLKKAGRNFKANCPFHSEKSPSFVVSPERQIWHCFGCSKGGDLFTFLMEFEKIDFSESLKELANRAGVKLTTTHARSEVERKKEIYYTLNHLSSQFYTYLLLKHKAGKDARAYLESRKISEALIATFSIGYAPKSGTILSEYLINKKHYKEEDIINAGLATRRGRQLYDFFRDRVIFSIKDSRGNIIAFSGRTLTNNPLSPKYINTKETLVYKKGDTLYGLFEAKEAIKREKRVIVVEGEFDVISSFREGIPNTVAVKGTALTQSQVKLLKRYTEKISFCFDTDPAGMDAMTRSIPIIEREGLSATVIQPPNGKDPDEALVENPTAYKVAIKKDVSMYDFLIDHTVTSFDSSEALGKRRIIEKVLPQIAMIDNEVVKEHYFRRLAGLLDTSLEAIVRQSEKIRMPSFKVSTNENPTSKITREDTIEYYLLSLILQAKDLKKAVLLSEECLKGVKLILGSYNKLYQYIVEAIKTIETPTIIEVAKLLPTEFLPLSDKCYLAPLPHFPTENEYYHEIHKTACDARAGAIKYNIKKIAGEIRDKEKTGSENELLPLQEEFNRLTLLLQSKP